MELVLLMLLLLPPLPMIGGGGLGFVCAEELEDARGGELKVEEQEEEEEETFGRSTPQALQFFAEALFVRVQTTQSHEGGACWT